MPDESSDPGVRYSTKEMLAKIDLKVDAIALALIGKADLSALVAVNLNLEDQQRRMIEQAGRLQSLEAAITGGADHGRRIVELERSDAIYQATSRDRKYLYGALLTLISVLVAVGGLILAVK